MPIIYKEYEKQEVLNAINLGLTDYLEMARIGLRNRWKSLSVSEKWAAGRALVALSDIKKNPTKYFSRVATYDAWKQRADNYAKEKKLPSTTHAYYIVPDPTNVVWNNVAPAFIYNVEHGKRFYRFCQTVQKWEYARTAHAFAEDGVATLYGYDIVNMAKSSHRYVDLKKTNPMIRPIKEMFRSFSK